ncbi:class A beta-lactamase-related serine hydrolase [Flavobacteriaceae bacterium]|nr:class A beta-lactamase-related serine hydrolase [Flavobacteriaceae bacterium]
MFKNLILVVSLTITISCNNTSTILDKVLNKNIYELQKVLKNKEKHDLQILLNEIKRDDSGKAVFKEDAFQLDEGRYFYPASTAKLPIAILSLQKINELRSNGLQISGDTPFFITDKNGEILVKRDSTHSLGILTINHLIKKIFLVSDDNAYNYLFDFLGTDYINKELTQRGLSKTRLYHKFLFGADNINTWGYTFLNENQKIIYHQPSISALVDLKPNNLKGILKGIGHIKSDSLLLKPMNFERKNRISIRDLEGILKRIIFPEAFSEKELFNLTKTDYKFLRYWMSRTTLESNYPDYNDDKHWDSYCKFFIYGDQKGAMIPEIRIFNKVGQAYGTLTDVAYIKDEKNKIEFFLTATILVNKNMIYNDDIYEYDEIGIPFLAALGRSVHKEIMKSSFD